MSLFRRNTIFHVERSSPDAEDLKLRFRRRVLGLTFLGFLVILGLPVVRELSTDLITRNNARILAEKFIESRALAISARTPISLALSSDGKSWERKFHLDSEDCSIPMEGPFEVWQFENHWKIQMKIGSGETKTGSQICWHPRKGILFDNTTLEGGTLLIAANHNSEDTSPSSSYLLLSEYGSDLQIVSSRRP
jgi:hypothetical protein